MAFERLGGLFGRLKDRFGEDKVYEGNTPPMAEPVSEAPVGLTPEAPVMSDSMKRTQGFEGGHKQSAYLDTLGYPTIATGSVLEHTKYDKLPEKYANMNVSEAQGNEMFHQDYATKASEIEKLYGEGYGNLPQPVRDVMTDMAYNVGSEGLFKKFPGMVKDIRAGNYGNAANQLKYKDISLGDTEGNISNWWNQVGGTTTEGNIASGEWGDNSRIGNRATANYDILSGLGNTPVPQNQPVDDTMQNFQKSNLANYIGN